MPLSVNFSLASDPRTTSMTKFEFNTWKMPLYVNFPKARDPKDPT